jgi:hypothetical protein
MDAEAFPGSAVHDLGGISETLVEDARNPDWDRVAVAAVRAYVLILSLVGACADCRNSSVCWSGASRWFARWR